jgi:hypothetical protein
MRSRRSSVGNGGIDCKLGHDDCVQSRVMSVMLEICRYLVCTMAGRSSSVPRTHQLLHAEINNASIPLHVEEHGRSDSVWFIRV